MMILEVAHIIIETNTTKDAFHEMDLGRFASGKFSVIRSHNNVRILKTQDFKEYHVIENC